MAEKKDEAPAQGSAAPKGQESRQSADASAVIPDALGNKPEAGQNVMIADKTVVKEFPAPKADDNTITAAATPPGDQGLYGMALPTSGEVGGGNIKAVLEAPPDPSLANRPMVKEQAALTSKMGKQIAGFIARPVTEWGVIGPGETIRGHMLLLDLNTGDKVRAMDGHRVNEGELYMNLRNVPEALSTGDTIDRVVS